LLALFIAPGGGAYAATPNNGDGGGNPQVYGHFGPLGGPPIGRSKNVVEAVHLGQGDYCVITNPGVDPTMPFVATLSGLPGEQQTPTSGNDHTSYMGSCESDGRTGFHVQHAVLLAAGLRCAEPNPCRVDQGFTIYAP
jgi:hypothetical protein